MRRLSLRVNRTGASKSAFSRRKRKFVAALHNYLQVAIRRVALIQGYKGVPRWNSPKIAVTSVKVV
jgi:hypothetical protein